MLIEDLSEILQSADTDIIIISTDGVHLRKIKKQNFLSGIPKSGASYANNISDTTDYVVTGVATLNGATYNIYIPKTTQIATSGNAVGKVGPTTLYAPLPTRIDIFTDDSATPTQSALIEFDNVHPWDMVEIYLADDGDNTSFVPCYIYKDLSNTTRPMSFVMPSGGYVTIRPINNNDGELASLAIPHYNTANTYVAYVNVLKY